ncbi:MAG: sulfatase [Verrucomicrobia bacterium]|nr:sulfatase [Verrucomicrobiota bacterium]
MKNPPRPWLLALVLCCCGTAFAAAPAPRPNVLFLISDDLRPELGCYGVAGIKTPNIDALAARSVRFNRAYVQYPLCNPQRTSLLTGRYPTQTGVLDNRQWWGREHRDWVTLPRYFRDHGYNTVTEGKIFHIGIDDTDAWTEGGARRRHADDASETIDSAASGKRAAAAPRDPDDAPAAKSKGPFRAGGSDSIVVLEGDGETYQDVQHAKRTVEYLKKYKDAGKPFFLACGFTNPHSPPRAPKKFYDLYDIDKMELPVDFAHRPTVPPGFPELSVVPRNTDLFIGRDASEAQAREMKRAYWAAVSFMDDNVGRILRALDELSLRDNTIVVLWGDHGYHLGEKGRWSKAYSLFEVAVRAPFLLVAPGVTPKAGAVCDRPIEMVNLYRTLAELCSLPAPDGVEGVSMLPLLRDPAAKWDRPAYSVVAYREFLGRTVRTDRWRYSQWVEAERGEVLFDEQNDPHELTNLAADPRHAAQLAEMKALLANLPGRRR